MTGMITATRQRMTARGSGAALTLLAAPWEKAATNRGGAAALRASMPKPAQNAITIHPKHR